MTQVSSRLRKIPDGLITKKDLQFTSRKVAKFIDSDVKSINLDVLLKVWISQLIDNAITGNPTYIEVRFYAKGALGFDIVDNGSGYTQSELAVICKCMAKRERNEIYKLKSFGYRGEALNSLCKSSKVVITTKHADEPTGLRVTFSTTGDIKSLEPVEMASPGTLVEVREVFGNNERYACKFRSNIRL